MWLTLPRSTCQPLCGVWMRHCKAKKSFMACSDKNPCASCPLHGDRLPPGFMEERSGTCIACDPSMDLKPAGISGSAGAFAAKTPQYSESHGPPRSFRRSSSLTACRNTAKPTKYAKGQPLAGRATTHTGSRGGWWKVWCRWMKLQALGWPCLWSPLQEKVDLIPLCRDQTWWLWGSCWA